MLTFLISTWEKSDGLLATFIKKIPYSLGFEGFRKLNPCNGALFQLEIVTLLCVFDDSHPGKVEILAPNNYGPNLPGHAFW